MIIALPAATPVTIPVAEFTVAAAVLLLLHAPPLIPLLVNGVDKPAHTADDPVTVPAFATAFTVMVAEVEDVVQADVAV